MNYLIRNGLIYKNEFPNFIINPNYIKISLDKEKGYYFKVEFYSNNEKTCTFFSIDVQEIVSFIEHNSFNNVDIYTYGIPKSFIANIITNIRNKNNDKVISKMKRVNVNK